MSCSWESVIGGPSDNILYHKRKQQRGDLRAGYKAEVMDIYRTTYFYPDNFYVLIKSQK